MRLDIQILRKIFPSILFNTAENIHVTIDDGPHPVATPFFLKELKKRNIRATFFLLGCNVQKFPDIVRMIHGDGHQIGNHSYSHSNLLLRNKQFAQNEILQTRELLESVIGTHSRYFRPPFGYFSMSTLNVLRELGLTCALWSIDSKDYSLASHAAISQRIIQKAEKGSIILLHDNDLASEKAQLYLPSFLDSLLQKGFKFETLPT
jgi:peptidoglycan-N-acetylglucosamine deacetylase